MPRIQLELPAQYAYSVEIPLRITDMNYGNHLGNDAVLSLLHEARYQYFRHLGYSEMDLGGPGTIMTDCAIIYKSEAFAGDVLQISMATSDFHKYGFDLYYKVWNTNRERLTAEAKTGICTYDYHEKKLVPLPEIVKITLQNSA